MNEQELKKEVGDVGEVSPRDVREADLAEVAARNFYKAMGYKELGDVPDAVRRSTVLAFQQTLHGLDLPVLTLNLKADSVLLVGVDVEKHGGVDDATKILGRFKGLFPRARIVAYDSRYLSISDVTDEEPDMLALVDTVIKHLKQKEVESKLVLGGASVEKSKTA